MHNQVKQKTSKHKQRLASCDPAELFAQLGSVVYGYALHMLAKPEHAEDVLSETFLRVCSRKDQYCGRGSVKSWVLGIAHRLCIDIFRIRSRRGKQVQLQQSLASSEPSPVDRSQRNERNRIIVEAIEKLPAEQKEVVMLKVYGHLTFREISDTLRVPLNTALGRMHSATKRLALDPNLARIGMTDNEL